MSMRMFAFTPVYICVCVRVCVHVCCAFACACAARLRARVRVRVRVRVRASCAFACYACASMCCTPITHAHIIVVAGTNRLAVLSAFMVRASRSLPSFHWPSHQNMGRAGVKISCGGPVRLL